MLKLFNIFKKKDKTNTLRDNLDLLTRYIQQDKLNFYNDSLREQTNQFLDKDIYATIKRYKYIVTFNIEQYIIDVPPITEHSFEELYFYQWYTRDRRLLGYDRELLLEWIELCKQVVALYEFRITLIEMRNYSYGNAKKIAPYYYNIKNTVETILKYI